MDISCMFVQYDGGAKRPLPMVISVHQSSFYSVSLDVFRSSQHWVPVPSSFFHYENALLLRLFFRSIYVHLIKPVSLSLARSEQPYL